MKKMIFTLLLIFTAYLSYAQTLYSTTSIGGASNTGTICKLDLATNTLTAAFSFGGVNGSEPYGSLVQASNGKLYGMTRVAGGGADGTIFSYDPATATFAKLKDFDGTTGAIPFGSLIQASDGKLYGMTRSGGSSDGGVIFSYDPATATYAKLKDFDYTNGAQPFGGLVQASNGKLYGMTRGGGSSGKGVIFSYDPATATYAKLKDFDITNGGGPFGSLVQASNGKLYGMTNAGGSNSNGVIFSYDPATATYAKLKDFDGTNGASPFGNLIQASNGKLYGMAAFGGSSSSGVIFSYDPATAVFAKLKDFDLTNGGYPEGSLLQASDGKLYGMTSAGGSNGIGVSFSYDPATSTYTKLADFTGSNGNRPLYTSFIEVCISTTWYRDADGDGFGDLNNSTTACSFPTPTGYVADHSDCDDTRLLYPDGDGDGFGAGSPVACGVADNTDCNDNDASVHSPVSYYKDNDHDGFGDLNNTTTACSLTPPAGYVTNSSDCDDTKLFYADNDGDGFGAGSPIACGVEDNTDCNDNDASVHSPITYYKDNDGDGFGDLNNSTTACSLTPPAGYVTNSTDCDDTKLLYADGDGDGFGAGSPVACGVADNTDCNDNDASVHNPITYYKDNDGDGFGDLNNTTTACSLTPPAGYVTNSSDCDDTRLLYADTDGDGFGTGSPVACGVANNTDCNDNSAAVHPGATEICGNGIDDNCDGQVDEGCTVAGSQISISDKSVVEGNKGGKLMAFVVRLSKPVKKIVRVNYTTQDITAIGGSDYTASPGTLTFLPGVKKLSLLVLVYGDKKPEADETFRVVLSNPVNATIADGTAIGTILNDDGAAPTKSIAQHQDAGSAALKDVKLSPNPANGKVSLTLTGYSGNVTIQLMDINGKLLQESKVTGLSKLSQQQIDISRYSNGVYLVTVMDEKGNRKTQKLVISR